MKFSVSLMVTWCVLCGLAAARQPNFIIIFTDDQGYQDVGCFGSPNIKTPHLDQLAADGVRCTDFYAMAPICSASRAGLLTGCYPPRVGTVGVYFPRHEVGLNPEETTIAELLKPLGYATACIGKWHLGHHRKFLPTSQGFDYYFGLPYSNDMDPVKGIQRSLDAAFVENDIRKWNVPLMRNEEIIERPAYQPTLTKRYTEEAVQFIDRHQQAPFFLYLPHTMPHIPLFASPEFHTKDPAQAYQRCIEEIDWSVGQILKALADRGLTEDTFVVFTSDNGPWLNLKPPHHGGSALPLRAGKFTTFEGGMRVPMIARWPGKIPPGTTCAAVAGTFDFLPTIAGMAGAPLPTKTIDGKDILPLLTGESDTSPHESFFYFRGGGRLQSMRKGPWKLHLPRERKGKSPLPAELYNLAEDISETQDVAAQHPDLVQELVREAQAFAKHIQSTARPEGKL